MFDWCSNNHHEQCRREYEVFFFDPRGKLVYTGETRTCQCSKRGCKCYIPTKERAKKKKTKRRSR